VVRRENKLHTVEEQAFARRWYTKAGVAALSQRREGYVSPAADRRVSSDECPPAKTQCRRVAPVQARLNRMVVNV